LNDDGSQRFGVAADTSRIPLIQRGQNPEFQSMEATETHHLFS
jgi:hypothetical protein